MRSVSRHRGASLVALLALATSLQGCKRKSMFHQDEPETNAHEPGELLPPTNEPPPVAMVEPGDPGAVELSFEVQTNLAPRAISPLIYGFNYHGHDLAPVRPTVLRFGGNRLTAYNWENNASNAGKDWKFQNDGFLSGSDEPAKPVLDIIDVAATLKAATIVTVSNADHVAADKNGGGDVRKSGPSYLGKRFRKNVAAKPSPLSAQPDLLDGAVYQDEFVAFLKAQRPQAKLLFSMDNEPELWPDTHAEIFPKPTSYADLWDRNYRFAKATKAVAPDSEVLGFVSYGYLGFLSLQSAPDSNGRNFIDWYLDRAREAEQAEGRRLIDYLDVHWYPEATTTSGKRIVGEDSDPQVVSVREQTPRSLWDPGYKETSWVAERAHGRIQLLPWLQAKIDAHYPGTKLAISEWNYGGANHISGAIAIADVLGIFGRHGVGLATYWPLSKEESFALAALRVFRNYDGRGAAFGDTSVSATTSDTSRASVYGSIDSTDPSKLVIIAINKGPATRVGVKITHATPLRSAQVYVLEGETTDIKPGPALRAAAANAFVYDMPAQSVVVLVPGP